MGRTRNDILNDTDAETKIRLMFEEWEYCCRQNLAKTKEEQDQTWKDLCLTRFRGDSHNPALSCSKCKAEFLNEEVD